MMVFLLGYELAFLLSQEHRVLHCFNVPKNLELSVTQEEESVKGKKEIARPSRMVDLSSEKERMRRQGGKTCLT
jgi:hypothetical protein